MPSKVVYTPKAARQRADIIGKDPAKDSDIQDIENDLVTYVPNPTPYYIKHGLKFRFVLRGGDVVVQSVEQIRKGRVPLKRP